MDKKIAAFVFFLLAQLLNNFRAVNFEFQF